MKQDNNRIYVILSIIGIIPVIWLALLIAPLLDGGLAKIINELPVALNTPFKISIVENSLKTVLIFLLIYGVSIGAYFSTRKNYKKCKEHGSANGEIQEKSIRNINNYQNAENRILTQDVRLGLNAKKHRRNLNTLVIGR